MRLIRATRADAAVLLEWRNDPATRLGSFTEEPITAEAHAVWLAGIIADTQGGLFLATDGSTRVGSVRIDRSGVISLIIAPAHRGKGHALPVLSAAELWARLHTNLKELTAWIRLDNPISLRCFARAGYLEVPGRHRIKGHAACRCTRSLMDPQG